MALETAGYLAGIVFVVAPCARVPCPTLIRPCSSRCGAACALHILHSIKRYTFYYILYCMMGLVPGHAHSLQQAWC
jgi:hypothetical protein